MAMELTEIIVRQHIEVDLLSRNKEELFSELVNVLVRSGAVEDEKRILDALWHREQVMNTVVAPHIALPHASVWLFKQTVGVLGISREGIDYGAPDGSRVHVAMLLVDDRYEADKHLHILKRAARLFGSPNFLKRMLASQTPEAVFEIIQQVEEMQRP